MRARIRHGAVAETVTLLALADTTRRLTTANQISMETSGSAARIWA